MLASLRDAKHGMNIFEGYRCALNPSLLAWMATPSSQVHRERNARNGLLIDTSKWYQCAAPVSSLHFCKIFNRATGLIFTEFVNRARVEQAKRLLLKPQRRITEVAYDVGFQSLSQFNRGFRRVTDESLTQYRAHLLNPALVAA